MHIPKLANQESQFI